VQLLLSSVGDIKQIGPGWLADDKDVDVAQQRDRTVGFPDDLRHRRP
jgi:hypothetical protein